MEPIYTYSRTGFSFTVYTNRIDIVDTSGFGAALTGGKKETILFRTITAVDVKGMTRKLHITTADGKTREFNLGGKSEEARQAIVALL